MSWLWLGAAAALQLLAGIVRVRAWFHVIRHSWPGPTGLGYGDVVVAHLGGVGWNAILPARSGDAVKVLIVSRRMRERRLALLASTLIPPGVVEAAFTALLVMGLLATSLVSLETLDSELPAGATVVIAATALCLTAAAAWVFRRRFERLVANIRAGLDVLHRPGLLVRCVVPWLLVGRALRLLAFACILPAAGLPLELIPALALMALHGATPSAGAAATAARIALLSAVLAKTDVSDVPAGEVAAALAAAYGVTSTVNLAASTAVLAWMLRTESPRRMLADIRTAARAVKPELADSSAVPIATAALTRSSRGLLPEGRWTSRPMRPALGDDVPISLGSGRARRASAGTTDG